MNRILNEIYKLKRERLLIDRLSKVKQRRLLKFGYTLEQIKGKTNQLIKLNQSRVTYNTNNFSSHRRFSRGPRLDR